MTATGEDPKPPGLLSFIGTDTPGVTEQPIGTLVSALQRRGPLVSKVMKMGSTSDKVSGLANQAAGKIKKGVGKATGDAKLETEGAAQDAKGKVQKGIGDAKGAIKDAVNKNF